MSQLSFSFSQNSAKDIFRAEDFIASEENSAARSFLNKFLAQEDFRSAQFQSLIIKGAQASGKSHLLHFFAQKFQIEFLEKEKISEINFVEFFKAQKFYILEDIDQIKDEELVLRLINSAFESSAFLILSLQENPRFQLKDLDSRIKNIFCVAIKNPSPETIIQLLVNGFARRQLKVPTRMVEFISDHVERDYRTIAAAINHVENFCHESGKNISMKDLEQMFGNKR